MLRLRNRLLLATLAFLGFASCGTLRVERLRADVCVYGATSAGVIAAIQACQQGQTVLLLDCDGWVGGLTTSGLGATDVGNARAIGGLAREFYRRLRRHYDRPEAWSRETREAFRGRGQRETEDAVWTFEPSVAQATLAAMLAENGVSAIPFRLAERRGVLKDGRRIVAISDRNGRSVEARCFLDCSYEGDLLAAAGCAFHVGRESNSEHGETLNGVQTKNATKHQFVGPVDPYVIAGDPGSGLLPGIDPDGPGDEGGADGRVQAYCFRICATDDPDNRVPWPKPAGYDAAEYELLLRHFEAGAKVAPWHPVWMPNRKTDSNNNRAVSSDWIGRNYDYPTADYETRAAIVAAHRRYQQGLYWTLANDPRVPESIRAEFNRFGLARDEFADRGNWPPLIYVREARRLVGAATVTEANCMSRVVAADPVGMASYTMDSHNVQRHVDGDGHVRNEGDVQVRVPRPWGVPFGALLPQHKHADNLLVPVCVSASHIAFGSVRMEPVFMVLGQSAAVAAGLAIERDIAVQEIPYEELERRLLAAGQVLRLP
ncbi:MAG: FAD-dependent oxidoreductase [Planctomycetes bacterium]|nr:FAD-dependent oxidoreductase [Planctomycetota bacterium]